MFLSTVAMLICVPAIGTAEENTTNLKPRVHEAADPVIQEKDLRGEKVKLVEPWRPGDPVRVVDDLRLSDMESDTKPTARNPVKPEVRKGKLDEIPTVPPMKPGDPVRVREDLKEDPKSDE